MNPDRVSPSATSYVRPAADTVWEHELEIKRSRFITRIARVSCEEEARAFIDGARALYPDARHHCSAYIYHVDGTNPVERSSDDGEPSGTAGKPMLDVLKGTGQLDICAVTIRYFGGIKLGAGGLVHAYSNSVSQACELVVPVQRAQRLLYGVALEHADAGKVEADLRARGWDVVGVDYADKVEVTLAIPPGAQERLAADIAAMTQGRVEPTAAGTRWVELPA